MSIPLSLLYLFLTELAYSYVTGEHPIRITTSVYDQHRSPFVFMIRGGYVVFTCNVSEPDPTDSNLLELVKGKEPRIKVLKNTSEATLQYRLDLTNQDVLDFYQCRKGTQKSLLKLVRYLLPHSLWFHDISSMGTPIGIIVANRSGINYLSKLQDSDCFLAPKDLFNNPTQRKEEYKQSVQFALNARYVCSNGVPKCCGVCQFLVLNAASSQTITASPDGSMCRYNFTMTYQDRRVLFSEVLYVLSSPGQQLIFIGHYSNEFANAFIRVSYNKTGKTGDDNMVIRTERAGYPISLKHPDFINDSSYVFTELRCACSHARQGAPWQITGFYVILYGMETFALQYSTILMNKSVVRYRCWTKTREALGFHIKVCLSVNGKKCKEHGDTSFVQEEHKVTDKVLCMRTLRTISKQELKEKRLGGDAIDISYGRDSANAAKLAFKVTSISVVAGIALVALTIVIIIICIRKKKAKATVPQWIVKAQKDKVHAIDQAKIALLASDMKALCKRHANDDDDSALMEDMLQRPGLSFVVNEWTSFKPPGDSRTDAAKRAGSAGIRTGNIDTCRYKQEPVIIDTLVECKRTSSTATLDTSKPQPVELHMNWVLDLKGNKRYILCQAPTKDEMPLFLTMIVEAKVNVILSPVNIMDFASRRVFNYFTLDKDSSNIYDNITIKCLYSVRSTPDFEVRMMAILGSGQEMKHTFVHVHYKGWTDFGTAEGPDHITSMWKALAQAAEENVIQPEATTIIHCSAGLGRSGCLVISFQLFDWIRLYGWPINIYALTERIRRMRFGVVQTFRQYLLLYCVASDFIKLSTPESSPRQLQQSMQRQ